MRGRTGLKWREERESGNGGSGVKKIWRTTMIVMRERNDSANVAMKDSLSLVSVREIQSKIMRHQFTMKTLPN